MIGVSAIARVRALWTWDAAGSAEAVAGGGAAARERRTFGLAGAAVALSSLCERELGRFAIALSLGKTANCLPEKITR
jgi:hypothetical protein